MASAPGTPTKGPNGQVTHTKIGTDADPTRGMPYHEQLTAMLKQALQKKKNLERQLAQLDEAIHRKESEYMEETPYGNIITGFDNYIKGVTSSAVAGRKRTAVNDNDRVFSRVSMRPGGDFADSPGAFSAQTTPSGAPTPVASSFANRDSNHGTPTSATSKNNGIGKNIKRKGKLDAEDSEMSEREGRKRIRK